MGNLRTLSVILLVTFICMSCDAQRLSARMPYSTLLNIAQIEEDATDVTSFKMKISSRLEGVPPEKIELILDVKDSPLHMIVDDRGNFDVPFNKALVAENPLLIANQPQGTLNISFSLKVPPFKEPKIENGRIKYKKLFEPLLELQRHVRKVDPTFGLMGNDQFALKILTEKPIKIVRESGSGDKKIRGSRTFIPKNGVVWLFMEAYMFKDDPTVEIPGKVTIQIKPVSFPLAQEIKSKY